MNDPEKSTCFGLLRHAPTVWNLAKRIQGHQDSPLTKEGEKQAGRWGAVLASGGWDRILASDLGRTRQTAQFINQTLNLPMTHDARLREKDWGDWTGKTIMELREHFPMEIKKMEEAGWQFRPPGGEDRLEVVRRNRQSLKEAAEKWPGERILVVTHEGVIKCLIYRLLNRCFLPSEPRVLKARHLHKLLHDGDELLLRKINALALNPVNRPEDRLSIGP